MASHSIGDAKVSLNGIPLEVADWEIGSIRRSRIIRLRLERAFTRAMLAVYAKHKNYPKRIQMWRAKKALMRIANHASKLDWI